MFRNLTFIFKSYLHSHYLYRKLFLNLSIINKNECELFTYMQVREDGILLFGFSTKSEKDLFLKLITVNGVGKVKKICF